MKRKLLVLLPLLLLLITALLSCNNSKDASLNRTVSFDSDWRFLKGDPDSAENPSFDDSGWRVLDLPHDWSIEDLPEQDGENIIGPFSKASVGKMGTGYTVGGTAWYRKHFTIDEADQGKTAYLQFDGVYMNSDVWVNGKHLGNHPYGYTSFWYNITPCLNPAGEENTVAVQVKNEGFNARWYSGSGIYRHTWLTLVDPVHIAPLGVYVHTPEVSNEESEIEISTRILNTSGEDSPVAYRVRLYDPSGIEVGSASEESSLTIGESKELKHSIRIENPVLWSIENPGLYSADVVLTVNNRIADKLTTTFGIRSIKLDAQSGFTLNGETVLLKGGNFHHDNGPLGAAAIDRAVERKIELLKDAGFNAIRCSHNPPSPYLLDLCDRLGMLVIDEAFDMWELPKVQTFATIIGGSSEDIQTSEYAHHFKECWQKDLQSMLLRDRNHPSVIMWSIGNEIPEAADSSGLRIARSLVDVIKKFDTSRPITEAVVDLGADFGMGSTWEQQGPHLALLDVIGYNYGYEKYREDHKKHPERIMYAAEFKPPLSLQNWKEVEELPYVIGNFSWTAMDYLGEAGTGVPRMFDIAPDADVSNPVAELMMFFDFNSWPMFVSFLGDIDLIGNPKPAYYYQHVVWRDHKMSMFVHRPMPHGKRELVSPWGFPDELKCWSWEGHEGEMVKVNVYTRADLVTLELNGEIIGEQSVDDSQSITATFEVPYEPGTLTARCFENGVEVAFETLKTLGKPAAIRLNADRATIKADRDDLSYVMVEIIDSEGNVIPNADDILVNFHVEGNGEIAGVGSGSPTDLSSFQKPHKKTWHGRCLAIVRPLEEESGTITLIASAEGLDGATIEISTKVIQ